MRKIENERIFRSLPLSSSGNPSLFVWILEFIVVIPQRDGERERERESDDASVREGKSDKGEREKKGKWDN